MKERCQKGIPPSLRGRAWLYLTGGKVKREQNQGKFQVSPMFLIPACNFTETLSRQMRNYIMFQKANKMMLCFQEMNSQPGDPKWVDIIERDLHRQFPFHEMFAARGGHG